MKKKITKAEYEELQEPLKALYVEDGDGYRLDLEDDDDIDGLKRNRDRLLEEKKRIAEEKAKLEALLKEQEEARKAEEAKRLEEEGKYKELLEMKQAELAAQIEEERKRAELERQKRIGTLLDLKVKEIAVQLAGERAPLIEPHIRNRLKVVEEDGVERVVPVTAGGVVDPTFGIDKLIEEFKSSDLFAPVIKGRESTGGGLGGGAGGSGEDWGKYFDPESPEYSLAKQIELEKQDKARHDALAKKYGLMK